MQKDGKSFLARIGQKLRENKKLELCVYGGIALVVIVCYAVSFLPEKRQAQPEGTETAATEATGDLEKRLKAVLGCIRGAGRVEVMVTYETGTELVTAMTKNVNSNQSESSDEGRTSTQTETTESSEPATVSAGGSDEPIVLMEKQPVVRGVIVVAEGAADIRVKLDLQRAVKAVLDIPLSQIEVFELSAESAE